MKTSNKLFVAVVGLVLGSLGAYDAALRAEYRTGHYKDPFANYNALALRNFDAIAVPAASAVSVKIVAGPFAVHVHKDAAEYVHLTQQGQRLTIALDYPKESKFLGFEETVVISCPQLRQLTTDGVFTIAGQTRLKKRVEYGNSNDVIVQGFSQDSLLVQQDHAGSVELIGNTLGQLRAVVGTSVGSGPVLKVDAGNRIQNAMLAMGHQSQLDIRTSIPQLRYQLSDSTKVTFAGAAVQHLKQ
jgi:hypothetical protein